MKSLQNIKDTRKGVLIASTVRNCGQTILKTIEALDKYLGSTKREFFIVESDSDDDTLTILENLARRRSDFKYLSMGSLQSNIPKRTDRIAFCRNKYLEYLRLNCENFEYLIVVDSDGIVSKIDDSNVLSSPDVNWHTLTANVSGFYYDLWALRSEHWCNYDCWKRYRNLIKIGMNEYHSYKISVWSPTTILNPRGSHLKVDSAFGGLAIYKVKSIPKSARYVGVDAQGEEICEHVSFNLAINRKNLHSGMYILPGLIIGKSPSEHVKYAGISGLIIYRLRNLIKSQLRKRSIFSNHRT